MKKGEIDDDTRMRLMVAYLCITKEAEASVMRKVEILDRFDLPVAEIAKVCGVKQQSVRDARHSLKKTRHARKKK